MKLLIYSIGRWNISISLVLLLLTFANCTSLLTAKFESDTVGNLPNKTLPGNPSGDEITYVSGIEGQLEVVASPASGSSKALEYKGTSISGDVSGHSAWLGFKAKSSNFAKPVTFFWSARRSFPSSGANLIIDISDGSGVVAARIRLSHDGTVRLITNIVTSDGNDIGTIPNNEQHTVSVTVDLSNGVYSFGVLKSSGNFNSNNVPLLTPNIASYHNPARPTASFKYDNYISTFNYIIDEIFINRKND